MADNLVPEENSTRDADAITDIYDDTPRYEQLDVIKQYVSSQIGEESQGWVDDLAQAAIRFTLDAPEIRSLATDLAWISRASGEKVPPAVAPIPEGFSRHAHLFRLIRAYVVGQRLRFDFKFDALRDAATPWLKEFDGDALILSFAAFANFGLQSPHALTLYKRAISSENADHRTRHVSLAGLWFAHYIPEAPEMMIELSDTMISLGEMDSNVFFRRAFAFRKLKRYEEALNEIDHAITLLDPGNNFVHQDYIREREVIIAMMDMHRHAESLATQIGERILDQAEKRIEEASQALSKEVESAQKVVSAALLKVVEILGLFVTLVGFLVGSGVVAFRASSFGEQALAMVLTLVGALIFFILLRQVTSFRRKR
ncbi:hypothetical protein ACWDLG_34560 [Nonomuraea sp. NPDC003727]